MLTQTPNQTPAVPAQSAQERTDALRAEQQRREAEAEAVDTAEIAFIHQANFKKSAEQSGKMNQMAKCVATGAVLGIGALVLMHFFKRSK